MWYFFIHLAKPKKTAALILNIILTAHVYKSHFRLIHVPCTRKKDAKCWSCFSYTFPGCLCGSNKSINFIGWHAISGHAPLNRKKGSTDEHPFPGDTSFPFVPQNFGVYYICWDRLQLYRSHHPPNKEILSTALVKTPGIMHI